MSNRLVALVFVLGLALGMGAGRLLPRAPRRADPERLVARLASELELSPAQREEFSRVFAANRERLAGLRSEGRAKFDRLREETQAQLRRALTPAQREKFDRLEARHAEQRAARRAERKRP